jgi:hypothetical protein
MFRAQTLQTSDPLVDVHAMVGDGVHADAQIGGGDGNVLTANVNDLAGINADVNVHAGGNSVDTHAALGTAAVTGQADIGAGVEVDGHLALGNGVGVDAHTGLDGALINAAVNVDHVASQLIDSDSFGDCGCTDTNGLASASTDAGDADVHANVNLPDIGLPLSLSALDFSGNDMACSDHV